MALLAFLSPMKTADAVDDHYGTTVLRAQSWKAFIHRFLPIDNLAVRRKGTNKIYYFCNQPRNR